MHPFCKFMSKFSGEIKITHDTETNSPAIPIIKPTIMTRPTQTTIPSNNFLILSFVYKNCFFEIVIQSIFTL